MHGEVMSHLLGECHKTVFCSSSQHSLDSDETGIAGKVISPHSQEVSLMNQDSARGTSKIYIIVT